MVRQSTQLQDSVVTGDENASRTFGQRARFAGLVEAHGARSNPLCAVEIVSMLLSPRAPLAIVSERYVPGPNEGMACGASRNPVSLDTVGRVCFRHPHRAHDFGLEFGAVGALSSLLGESEIAHKCGGGTEAVCGRGGGH